MNGAMLILGLVFLAGCSGLYEQQPSYLDNYSAALSQQMQQGEITHKEAQDLYWAAVERERDRGIQRAAIIGQYLNSRPAPTNPYQTAPIDWSQWNNPIPNNQRLQTNCTTYGTQTIC